MSNQYKLYLVCSESEDIGNCDMLVQATNVKQAQELYFNEAKRLHWAVEEIDHIWLIPTNPKEAKALRWKIDIEDILFET